MAETDTRLLPQPSPWARHFLDTVGERPVPLYGSPEWAALSDNDPLRVASCVRAAEAWAAAGDPAALAARLATEIAVARAQERPEHRLADAIGWAATSRERVEGLAAAAMAEIRLAAAVAAPVPAFAPATAVVDTPDWPHVTQPGGDLGAEMEDTLFTVQQVNDLLDPEIRAAIRTGGEPPVRAPGQTPQHAMSPVAAAATRSTWSSRPVGMPVTVAAAAQRSAGVGR